MLGGYKILISYLSLQDLFGLGIGTRKRYVDNCNCTVFTAVHLFSFKKSGIVACLQKK
jgi:hypothetical protein